MKTFFTSVSFLILFTATGLSGPSQTLDKGITPSDEAGWYAAREFNVQLWGTYLATANEHSQDRFLEADHAWGGGLDAKYFFNRHIAVGIEGYAVSRTAAFSYITFFPGNGTTNETLHDTRTIGAGLATITFRYPIGASRFAPYVFAGGGFITGGAQDLRFEFINPLGTPPGTNPFRAYVGGSESEAIGQFGGGLEFRLTRHIGLINDFSWSVVNGRDNNFGMARTGINFAF